MKAVMKSPSSPPTRFSQVPSTFHQDQHQPNEQQKRDMSPQSRCSALNPIDLDCNGSNDDDSMCAMLSWRLNPDVSFSDWTVVITAVNDNGAKPTTKVTEYHVHKSVIAVGPRRSRYFSTIMRSCSSMLSETRESTSKINLDMSAAAVFPIMLDFMYSPMGTPLDIKTQHAAPLRFLASYFDVRGLLQDVNAFIRKDLTCRTAPIYLAEGDMYRDDNLVDISCRVCAENIEGIYIGFLAALPPHLFRKVIKSPKLRCKSSWLSKIVSEFCRTQAEFIDADMVRDLTHVDLMPEIMEEEAMFLLKFCADHGIDDNREGSLRRRCIHTCSKLWKEHLARPLRQNMVENAVDKGSKQKRRSSETGTSGSGSSGQHGKSSPTPTEVGTPITSSPNRKSYLKGASGGVGNKHLSIYKSLPPSIQVELLESALCCALEDVDVAHQTKDNEINRLHSECKAKAHHRMVGEKQKSSRF